MLNFPKIHMPDDLVFVQAMDEVLNTVHAKKEFIEGLRSLINLIFCMIFY